MNARMDILTKRDVVQLVRTLPRRLFESYTVTADQIPNY